jgi:hypothetical protein
VDPSPHAGLVTEPAGAGGHGTAEVSLNDVLRAYLVAYARRRRKRGTSSAFGSPELAALAGLAMSHLGHNLTREADLLTAAAALDESTQVVLEHSLAHSPAVDIAGLAWARAYGVLALPEPALEHLEWVLQRGRASGSVRGLLAGAWRALFLASAVDQLDSRWRPQARTELTRRLAYIAGKLSTAVELAGPRSASGSDLRVAFVVGELANLEASVAPTAEAFARSVLENVRPIELPTSQLCQFALVAANAGEEQLGRTALEHMLRERWTDEPGLVRSAPGADFNFDSSPWIPLALIAFGASVAPPTAHPTAMLPRTSWSSWARRRK